jgi:ureidoglycolate lyase
MVLGRSGSDPSLPDLSTIQAFLFPPGHGLMLWQHIWHDFPMAVKDPVTIFTMNSAEVVEALASQNAPEDMNTGDVFKINLHNHTGTTLKVTM